jgi:hypothetical protein
MPLQRVIEPDALADEALTVIDKQPQVKLGPSSRAVGSSLRLSRSAARATASESMLSDFPRERAPRRVSAISFVGTRSTRSPRAINHRSNDPDTCRQSSSAQTRSAPSARAQTTSAANPRAPTATVFSPSTWPVAASTAAIVCDRL